VTDEKIDDEWPSPEEDTERDTVIPEAEPPTKPIPAPSAPAADPQHSTDEAPTKPKRATPPVLRLDSASAFERPESSTAHRRNLLNLADGATDLGIDVPEPSEALDLVAQAEGRRSPVPAEPAAKAAPARPGQADPLREMRERFSLGDYSGALVMAESLLEEDPDCAEAQKYVESCRNVLEQMYTARIGPLDRVPFVAVPPEQLRWLSIDHRAGFVLSHIDGMCSLEQILDVSGMPTLDALRILYELAQQRVIAFR
jgi:hypothetical protein